MLGNICYVLKFQTNSQFMNVLKQIYWCRQESTTHFGRKFQCQKCGSNVFHKSRDCLAKRNAKCFMCGKSNHLTVAYEKKFTPVLLTDFSLFDKLNRET